MSQGCTILSRNRWQQQPLSWPTLHRQVYGHHIEGKLLFKMTVAMMNSFKSLVRVRHLASKYRQGARYICVIYVYVLKSWQHLAGLHVPSFRHSFLIWMWGLWCYVRLLMANKTVTLIKGVSMNITAPGAKITCTTFFITPSVSGGWRPNLKASNPFPSADSQ